MRANFSPDWRRRDVAGCGKHFPGLGGGTRDSHLETPAIQRTWQQLWQEDLEPYRELRRAVADDHGESCGVSRDSRARRRRRASRGSGSTRCCASGSAIAASSSLTILEMGGIPKFMPIEEAAVAAVRGRARICLICHHPELILRVYEALIAEGERSAAFRKVLLATGARIRSESAQRCFPKRWRRL